MKNINRKSPSIWIYSTLFTCLTLLCGSAHAAPLRQWSGLTSIDFYESTSALYLHNFAYNDPALTTRLSDPLSSGNEDFHGVSNENYDVFYSNADGTFNANGAYLTIEAVYGNPFPAGGGLNIAEVYLNFSNHAPIHATGVVSHVFYGDNSIPGDLLNAIDGNLNTDTSMGSTVNYPGDPTRLRITLAFTPEPSSLSLLGSGVLGLGGFLRRRLLG